MDQARIVPTGETIGSYSSYLDAQKAVDYLADQKFPVQHVSIVGNDLKMVERVTGKLSYPRVALSGAMTGAWFGLFVGIMLSFFGSAGGEATLSIMTSVLMGAAFWMLFGIIGYASQRGKRDFTSTNQVLASSYDVIVTPDVASEARRLLAQLPMRSTAPAGRPTQMYPPQTPARPDGWHDPYGRPEVPAPASAGNPPAAAAAPEEAPVRGRFPDLPDGRPQYGIRVDTPAASPESGRPDGDAPESRG